MPDFEASEQTHVSWKVIFAIVAIVTAVIIAIMVAVVATGGIKCTTPEYRKAFRELKNPTVTKAFILMPDGSSKEINVVAWEKDTRYHTDQITIIDEDGNPWIVDSRNVVFTNDGTEGN